VRKEKVGGDLIAQKEGLNASSFGGCKSHWKNWGESGKRGPQNKEIPKERVSGNSAQETKE